jgi:hypothetical protein
MHAGSAPAGAVFRAPRHAFTSRRAASAPLRAAPLQPAPLQPAQPGTRSARRAAVRVRQARGSGVQVRPARRAGPRARRAHFLGPRCGVVTRRTFLAPAAAPRADAATLSRQAARVVLVTAAAEAPVKRALAPGVPRFSFHVLGGGKARLLAASRPRAARRSRPAHRGGVRGL